MHKYSFPSEMNSLCLFFIKDERNLNQYLQSLRYKYLIFLQKWDLEMPTVHKGTQSRILIDSSSSNRFNQT